MFVYVMSQWYLKNYSEIVYLSEVGLLTAFSVLTKYSPV